MNVAVVGCGHVGLVTAAALAEIGHTVVGVDSDELRVANLVEGRAPFYEPELEEMLRRHACRSLSFTTDIGQAVREADVAMICVHTPPRPDGRLSLAFVEATARAIAREAPHKIVVVERSTLPVRTARRIAKVVADEGRASTIEVATNPAFLREGTALHDVLAPSRIVIGVENGGRARDVLLELYAPVIERSGCSVIVTDLETAELIKHAANSYLASKVSYINLVARFCEATGADIDVVARGMGLDARIRPDHLGAGVGYGGFTLSKDVSTFLSQADELRVDLSLLSHVEHINTDQRRLLVEKVKRALWNIDGKVIAVWGLSYKAGTDDLRDAPALDVVPALEREGATIRAYDPAVGRQAEDAFPNAIIASDALDAVTDADALVVLTGWPEFAAADLAEVKRALRRAVIVDGRNLWPVEHVASLGFTYLSFGRPDVLSGAVRGRAGPP